MWYNLVYSTYQGLPFMLKNTIFALLIMQLFSCASTVNDPMTNVRAKTQCPIGYHLEQQGGIEVYSRTNDSQNKSTLEFKCVADREDGRFNNSLVN